MVTAGRLTLGLVTWETNLDIKINKVYTVQSNFHNPETHTVGIWFLAEVVGGGLKAQADLDEVGYFDLASLPELAFPTDALVIEKLHNELNSDFSE